MGICRCLLRSALRSAIYIVILCIGAFFSLLPWLQLFARCIRCKRPLRTPVDAPRPSTLDDPLWGTHRYVTANGLRFHYVERGPSDGPLVCSKNNMSLARYTVVFSCPKVYLPASRLLRHLSFPRVILVDALFARLS